MAKVSVLIPSRNEAHLNQTIQSCFDNCRGDLEVVVCLEGYWPGDWKDITARWPNLHTVHHGEPRGLRAAINSAAASAISRGADYLFKLDAHCMLDEGFDVKLAADMEPNWVVVPRRKRLDAETWTIKDVGKPDIDYHYLSFPDDPNDFGGKGLNGKVWDERIRQRLGKPEYDIDDEMASQGSAWFMSADYFQQLELMDEANYGPFWNESQEILCKAWLSGGRGVVNKKTWYAHLHKSKTYIGLDGKSGRGYMLPESWLKQGAGYTKRWIWNEAWAKQTLPFKWLVDHFWPVPTWPENWEEVLYAERKPRLVAGGADSVDYRGRDARDSAGDMGHGGELPVAEKQLGQGVKADEYADGGGLVIHSARYGVDADTWMDVTHRVRELVKDDSLDIAVNNPTLTPDHNPYRGKKKRLSVSYSYDGGEQVLVQREEKEWLIIGQQRREVEPDGLIIETTVDYNLGPARASNAAVAAVSKLASVESKRALNIIEGVADNFPRTATALNDHLLRKFSINPQRLRAPMPIELRDFHRNDLAQLFAELGFRRGAEIGVAEGKFSEKILQANPNCELLLVDPWEPYAGNPQSKSKEKHDFAYTETVRRVGHYPNVKLVRQYSMDAVRDVPKGSLDFIYIDGNHAFDYVMQDLIEWFKRVRSGGIVSGDDFYSLDPRRWSGGGVVEAVQAYVNAHRISPWFIFEGYKSTDFMWVKP